MIVMVSVWDASFLAASRESLSGTEKIADFKESSRQIRIKCSKYNCYERNVRERFRDTPGTLTPYRHNEIKAPNMLT
jgi:hypothetical protein